MKKVLVTFVGMAAALAGAGSAHAGYPYAWPNELGPTAYGVTGTMYGLGLVPVPPYFALHPPVYYSCPVPRSYGYSPYAYPPCVQTPEVDFLNFPNGDAPNGEAPNTEELPPTTPASKVAARGQWIANPFLTDPGHGMIANPFVNPQDGVAPLVLTSHEHANR
jgi:hypothetical protein